MKKTLLSFIMIGAVGVLNSEAQITLFDTDVVGIGDIVEQAHDTLPSAVNIGSGGASQTWNFATLGVDYLDTAFFVNPTTMPGNSSYPTSNIGMYESSDDSTWMYLNKNTTGLYVLGQTTYIQGNLTPINFAATIVTFPSTMGTNYAGTWDGALGSIAFGQDPDGPGPHGTVDSIRFYRYATVSSNIDGWGNVTTPLGTFNSLRQMYVEMNEDSTQQLVNGNWEPISTATNNLIQILLGSPLPLVQYDTTRTARWWTNNAAARFPVVEIDHDVSGNANSVTYLNASPFTGIENQTEANKTVTLYPNPAKNQVTISTAITSGTIEILDVTGKIVATNKISSTNTNLNISNLNNSIYFYNVKDQNGTTIYTNKFVVAK